jgi:hypothetical protein
LIKISPHIILRKSLSPSSNRFLPMLILSVLNDPSLCSARQAVGTLPFMMPSSPFDKRMALPSELIDVYRILVSQIFGPDSISYLSQKSSRTPTPHTHFTSLHLRPLKSNGAIYIKGHSIFLSSLCYQVFRSSL